MKEHTLELINVLSDPTRYSIYEYLIEAEKPVTVREVAEEMDIHNQTRSSGRPNRLYVSSEEAIEISFPYRDY